MKRKQTTRVWTPVYVAALVAAMVPAVCLAHDMFLVVPDHHLPAETQVTVSLYNGTFHKSENVIDRDRMIDVSVVDGQGRVSHPDSDQWREDGNVTLLDFRTAEPGTYIVGVSTAARTIELSAEEFNDYLQHDGVLDILEARKKEGRLDQPARERYSKHVKILLQVGGEPSSSYSKPLGYPIEIVPLLNPARLFSGDTLEVLVLDNGEPASGQLVYASYEGFHSRADSDAHREAVTVRTDNKGKAQIELAHAGRWYVRLIRMLPEADEGVDYESNWATLTFEIGE